MAERDPPPAEAPAAEPAPAEAPPAEPAPAEAPAAEPAPTEAPAASAAAAPAGAAPAAPELPAGLTEEKMLAFIENLLRTGNWDEITVKVVLGKLEAEFLPEGGRSSRRSWSRRASTRR